MKPIRRGLLYAVLAGIAAGALLARALRRRRPAAPVPTAPPAGGERDGEFELFIGS